MKNVKLLLVVFVAVFTFLLFVDTDKVECAANDYGVAISQDNFPDYYFRWYLSQTSIDRDQNGFLTNDELGHFIIINISNRKNSEGKYSFPYWDKIADLTGIELLPSVTLDCSGCPMFAELDLSDVQGISTVTCENCLNLRKIILDGSSTRKLDCDGCYNLEEICLDNCDNLTSVSHSSCTKLSVIPIMSTQITIWEHKDGVGYQLVNGETCRYSYEYQSLPVITVQRERTNGTFTTLTEGGSYSISYVNNEKVGKVTGIIEGKGTYIGKKTFYYQSVPADISNRTISAIQDQVYSGEEKTPNVTVVGLVNGTDYTVSYIKNINAGVATVTVTGKGNYTGTKSSYFIINSKSIEECVVNPISNQTYTGKLIKPSLEIMDGERVLVLAQDYTASYSNRISPGTNTVTIEGKGNYTGTISTSFRIVPKPVADVTVNPIDDVIYDGEAKEPSVTVIDGNKTLKLNEDYSVAYENNIFAGTASVIIKGRFCYTGERKVDFSIKPKSISSVTISEIPTQYYTGAEIEPDVEVFDGQNELVNDKDYTVSYTDNKNSSTYATVTIKGINNYSGQKTTQFYISKVPVSKTEISSIEPTVYTGKTILPVVKVLYNEIELIYGTDYTIGCSGNDIDAGEVSAYVIGQGNYTGTKEFTFTISRNGGAMSIRSIPDQTYSGNSIKPEVVVSVGDRILAQDVDYVVSFSDNKTVGTAGVLVEGIGNYSGTGSASFNIVGKSITSASVSSIANQTYCGAAISPNVTVVVGSRELALGTDYIVGYTNNTNVGTATITITGIGNYTGVKTTSFKITAARVELEIEVIDSQMYSGYSIEPDIVVKIGSKTLVEGRDYSVVFFSNKNVGVATVVVDAKGNYIGRATTTFAITAKPFSFVGIPEIEDQPYTGGAISPNVTITDGLFALSEGTDYIAEFSSNKNVGVATVMFTGIGNYTGTQTVYFSIVPCSDWTVAKISNQEYTGKPIEPIITVKTDNLTLKEGTDYTVSYKDNTELGDATVTVTGIGNFKGEQKTSFKVLPRLISNDMILPVGEFEYSGEPFEPVPTVKVDGKSLVYGTDYYCEYKNNVDPGIGSIYVFGIGNYTGVSSTSLVINRKAVTITIDDIDDQTFTGSKIEPAITVRQGDNVFSSEYYTYEFTNNKNVGTASVTVQMDVLYYGSASKTFKIKAKSIEEADISLIEDQLYTGSAITPDIVITDGKTLLALNKDYEVEYSNNIEIGKAAVIVTGINNYTGSITVYFNIKEQIKTGWITDSDGKKYYYINNVKLTGRQTIDGKKYYFSKTTGVMVTGWKTLSKKLYYFDPTTGVMATGWKTIDGKRHYFNKDTGVVITGWKTISKKKYYFDPGKNGAAVAGVAKKISGYYYLFDAKGVMQKSGWKKDSKGNTYYLKSTGKAYTKKWVKKSGKWYYFGSNAKMVKGKSLKIGKKTYKFTSTGVCKNP